MHNKYDFNNNDDTKKNGITTIWKKELHYTLNTRVKYQYTYDEPRFSFLNLW